MRAGSRLWADLLWLALLLALLLSSAHSSTEAGAGKGGKRARAATTQSPAAPGRGALWERGEGSLRAELQTLPTSATALVFICHVHCDLFPVRFGLNKGSAAEKRFKTTEPALAFTELIKKVDSGEGTRPVTASQAHVTGDSGVA